MPNTLASQVPINVLGEKQKPPKKDFIPDVHAMIFLQDTY